MLVAAARVHDLGKIASDNRILFEARGHSARKIRTDQGHARGRWRGTGGSSSACIRKEATTSATITSAGTARAIPTAWRARDPSRSENDRRGGLLRRDDLGQAISERRCPMMRPSKSSNAGAARSSTPSGGSLSCARNRGHTTSGSLDRACSIVFVARHDLRSAWSPRSMTLGTFPGAIWTAVSCWTTRSRLAQ